MGSIMPCAVSLLLLMACDRPTSHAPLEEPTKASTAQGGLDTAAAFRTTIADYITAMDTSAAPLPDTVHIGRHVEFPAIQLPAVLARRTILVIDPETADTGKDREHFAYLNALASFTPGHAEFFVVRFMQGMAHRPDGRDDRHLHYTIRGKDVFELDSLGP